MNIILLAVYFKASTKVSVK